MKDDFLFKTKFPLKNSVSDFTECLYHYLFQSIDSNEQKLILENLKTALETFIKICNTNETLETKIIVEKFFKSIPDVVEHLLKDANFIFENDPAANCLEEVVISYPGFYAICIYRLANILYQDGINILPRMMSEIAHSKTGIDIHAGATIGCPFFIDHGTGIVIGETTIIGNNVKLYQGVTLGALAVRKADAAIKRHPTIENDVVIYASATILGGNTTIGHDCIIGGNSWITESVTAFSVVYHSNQTVVKDRKDFKEPINFII